ncbi:MAG: arsenate reductase family protein [Opitutales bacterium]|nr:arsenate reductase family protein [Opitutales bacterium]
MKTIRVYTYSKCSTCRKATAWLNAKGIDYEEIPIAENPPSIQELARMEKFLGGKRGRLFNTSGREYRSLGLKDKLPDMSAEEAYALLNGNGMLVKRPFLITPQGGAVGFREAEWQELL